MLASRVTAFSGRSWRHPARLKSVLSKHLQRLYSVSLSELDTSGVHQELAHRAKQGDVNGAWEAARELLCSRHEQPDSRLHRALIQANVGAPGGSVAAIDTLLQELDVDGYDVGRNIFCDALKVLAVHPEPLLRGHILEEMRQRWLSPDHETLNLVLLGLLRDGQVENALEQIEDMQQKGVMIRSWVFDLAAYMLCDLGEIDEAARILKRRIIAGDTNIHQLAWFRIFDAACALMKHDTMEFLWNRGVKTRVFNPSSGQCLATLRSASQTGQVELATDVFRVLSERRTAFDSHHYELLIGAYLENEDIKTPFTILCIMNKAGILPDQSSTPMILNTLCDSPERISEAFSILEELNKTGKTVPTAAINCLIEASLLNDDLPGAIGYYKSLHMICSAGPDIVTFNTLLKGCKDMQRKKTAMFLVAEMVALGVRPTSLTYDRLILTCLGEDALSDAYRYYEEMKTSSLHLRFGTFKLMAEKLCTACDERSWDLVADMHKLRMPTLDLRENMAAKWREFRVAGRLNEEQERRPRQVAQIIDNINM